MTDPPPARHAPGADTRPDLEAVEFTIADSQELAALIDPHQRAIEFADRQYSGRRAAHVAAYWAAADGFEAGWQACVDLYEGRRK